jgi:predicted nucleotidyltransferase
MNFARALQVLVDQGVDFVVVGGWSGIFHGSRYLTNDLDICYSRSVENLKRLAAALVPFRPRLRGLPQDLPFVWDEVTLRNGSLFTLSTDLGDIDLLAEITGVGAFDQVKEHSILVDAFGRSVWTLDLRTLIRAKRAAGREKDLRALAELESLLEAEE